MEGKGHRLSTKKAFDILKNVFGESFLHDSSEAIANEAVATDTYRDLEFVDVEGGIFSDGRDNPHQSELLVLDDRASCTIGNGSFTAFNHFIDIKKGPGKFDDYDGYSYFRGSAHKEEFQEAGDATEIFLAKLVAKLVGKKLDAGIAWWFSDEYVHSPSHPWYKGCSPAVERYSFPQEKGIYPSVKDEMADRFPMADSIGHKDKGIPYSIFMPVDNLGRYWYSQFLGSRDPVRLGPVMHAIQDASVPHHTAGYCGNWHGKYEVELSSYIEKWCSDKSFANEVSSMLSSWSRPDQNPPKSLAPDDWCRTPAINWRVDMLITWVALNAYREYDKTYSHFRGGYRFDANSARYLTKLAIAISALVLRAASESQYKEDIISFDHNSIEVKKLHDSWKIVDGDRAILDFGTNGADAQLALSVLKHYKLNRLGFVGRPDPAMTYFLKSDAPPSGNFVMEDALEFDPERLQIKQTGANWKIVHNERILLDFGSNKNGADMALWVIKKYGFTHICYVGRPHPTMVYFRC